MEMIEVDEKKLDALLENSLISCLGISSDYFGDRSCEKVDSEIKVFMCSFCNFRDKKKYKRMAKKGRLIWKV